MSIPLDRLYHYIKSVAKKVCGDVVIYRFFPHGSKKLENLQILCEVDWYTTMTTPPIICHDQEPLNYDFYQNHAMIQNNLNRVVSKYNCWESPNVKRPTIFDTSVLIHSEKQSVEVSKYKNSGFIPVYYWSHGLISLDWFRFAQHLSQNKKTKKTFLIYNRAWQGTREYRIKFVEMLYDFNLVKHCQTTFNPVDPENKEHYHSYCFKNEQWKSTRDLSLQLTENYASSNSSADFDYNDYESTNVEVVLETLFDDSRLHLTEKILRPIACAQPFILVSTPGSLNYLKTYGFKTFDDIWDESYDQIQDHGQRLKIIAKLMKDIANWDITTQTQKFKEAISIAEYNKNYFFSNKFFELLNYELEKNLKEAITTLKSTNTSKNYLDRRAKLCRHLELKKILTGKLLHPDYNHLLPSVRDGIYKTSEVMKVLTEARKYMRNPYRPS